MGFLIYILLAGFFGAFVGLLKGRAIKKERQDREEAEKERKNRLGKLYNDNLREFFLEYLQQSIEKKWGYFPTINVQILNRVLYIDYGLPKRDEVNRVKEVRYLKNGERREKLYSDRDFAKVYETELYKICLQLIDTLFKADSDYKIDTIAFNGFVEDYSLSTGQLEKKTILSIMANRSQFDDIDLAHVDPKICFKSLGGVSGAKLIDLSPVTPIITFDKNDRRFIKGEDVSVNKGTNLAAMDWQDFEQLVREVFQKRFEKDGWDVNVTRASRDGGVDAIIYNPDPLTGGKILVQAKRYTNTVGVSAVRDLYGTMTDERASRGILITTSDYGSDSLNFAKDKPITLLNGGHLLGMLHDIGMEGYINIQEAKESLKTE